MTDASIWLAWRLWPHVDDSKEFIGAYRQRSAAEWECERLMALMDNRPPTWHRATDHGLLTRPDDEPDEANFEVSCTTLH